jgi:hypothetical protein
VGGWQKELGESANTGALVAAAKNTRHGKGMGCR